MHLQRAEPHLHLLRRRGAEAGLVHGNTQARGSGAPVGLERPAAVGTQVLKARPPS